MPAQNDDSPPNSPEETSTPVQIWHYGLIARWWAEFNEGGEDLPYFQRAVTDSGEPALDAGCGTGRLLLPFRRLGIDVDGSDASADMLDWCRRKLNKEGLAADLYAQAMHRLELPRRYQTVLVCGAFGLGSQRADDLEGLRRIHAHLQPGGRLILDQHLPLPAKEDWPAPPPQALPQDWPQEGDRRLSEDGSELELRTRLLALDPGEQTLIQEVNARRFIEGCEVASESYSIQINVYSKHRLETMLESAGFRDLRIDDDLADVDRRPGMSRSVFHATA